jgi:hypothetical protein
VEDWIQLTEAATGWAVAFPFGAITRVSSDPQGATVYTGASSAIVLESYADVLHLLGARPATVASRTAAPAVGVSQGVARGRDKRGEGEASDA